MVALVERKSWKVMMDQRVGHALELICADLCKLAQLDQVCSCSKDYFVV